MDIFTINYTERNKIWMIIRDDRTVVRFSDTICILPLPQAATWEEGTSAFHFYTKSPTSTLCASVCAHFFTGTRIMMTKKHGKKHHGAAGNGERGKEEVPHHRSVMYLQAQAVNKAAHPRDDWGAKRKIKNKSMRPKDIENRRLKDLGYEEELLDVWTSASRGELGAVKAFVDAGNDINMQPGCYPNGTILHEAVQTGKTDVVKYLIEKGANVNALDDVQNTPLHRAAIYNKTGIIRLLLNARAKQDLMNDMDRTPWELAKLNGQEEAAALLPVGDLTNVAAMLQYEERIKEVLVNE